MAHQFINLSNDQKSAIRCAYLDLIGAMEANRKGCRLSHDWDAHNESITDLEKVFSDLLDDLIKEEDEDI